jgi:hypothetical protein
VPLVLAKTISKVSTTLICLPDSHFDVGMIMVIPFEQMAEDHRRDVRITKMIFDYRKADLCRGHLMWLMATVGFGYEQSVKMIDVSKLTVKYPTKYGNTT